ncbi:hypothetical protein LOTGIDRAFT_160196 [Lottia gigantea]|uniref:Death domain-containing protein n=1 Tax=Lottia gigantea TaxID=225164 RepID=V4C2C3_LOTGI|nr:hypothetical protein LOTGIDRAFT_160196 [Lottia gigantea]ESO95649.1 hypothetical protein LOTGIDRAFT_160196 [Lottia gigantea]
MADQEDAPPPQKPKEVEVLSESSMTLLARFLGQENDIDIIMFAMLLNIPTAAIIRNIFDVNPNGFGQSSPSEKVSVSEKCVLMWKELTKEGKTRERIRELERALREMDKGDVADTVIERHQNKMELTPDVFAQ